MNKIIDKLNDLFVKINGSVYLKESDLEEVLTKYDLEPTKIDRIYDILKEFKVKVVPETPKVMDETKITAEEIIHLKSLAGTLTTTLNNIEIENLEASTKIEILNSIEKIAQVYYLNIDIARPISRGVEITKDNAGITEKAILIRINQLYYEGISRQRLYDITRSAWKVGKNRERVDYAFAVYNGLIIEVYKIKYWELCVEDNSPHDWTNNKWNESKDGGRYQFVGCVDYELSNKYKNKSVKELFPKGAANPIKYINI